MKTSWFRLTAVSAVFLLAVQTVPAFCQSGQFDQVTTQNIEQLTRWVSELDGRMSSGEEEERAEAEIIRDIAIAATKNPALMEIAGPLSRLIRDKSSGNQKAEFLRAIADIACQNARDNCELKRQVDEHERRIREIEDRRNPEPTPTPTPAPEHGPAPQTVEPQPPLVPAPNPSPYAPSPPYWDGTIHSITDRPNEFCPDAVVIRRGIICRFPDGGAYHGDVVLTCRGYYVFLRRPLNQRLAYGGSNGY